MDIFKAKIILYQSHSVEMCRIKRTVCVCARPPPLSVPDGDAEMVSLEPDSVSFMEGLVASGRGPGAQQNGFSPTLYEEDSCDVPPSGQPRPEEGKDGQPPRESCPVGLHKAVLLYPPWSCQT